MAAVGRYVSNRKNVSAWSDLRRIADREMGWCRLCRARVRAQLMKSSRPARGYLLLARHSVAFPHLRTARNPEQTIRGSKIGANSRTSPPPHDGGSSHQLCAPQRGPSASSSSWKAPDQATELAAARRLLSQVRRLDLHRQDDASTYCVSFCA